MKFFLPLRPMKPLTNLFVADAKGDASGEADTSMASQLHESNLEPFLEQIQNVAQQTDTLACLLSNLKVANEESKSVTSAASLKAIRKRMEKNINEVGKTALTIKVKLVAINKDNLASREKPNCGEGTTTDRIRTNMTFCSTKRFKGLMTPFELLRQSIEEEYRELLERRLIAGIGTIPDEEIIDRLIETGKSEIIIKDAMQETELMQVMNSLEEFEERHDTLRDFEKKFTELHQIYLDMAVLIEAQGDMLDHIETQVSRIDEDVQVVMDVVQRLESSKKKSRKWSLFFKPFNCFLFSNKQET